MAWFSREYLIQNARFVLLVLLLLLVVGALYFFHDVLLPFAMAIFLAYLLAPVVEGLHRMKVGRWHVPRGAAILLVYVVILGLIVLSGIYLFPRFYSEVNRMVKTLPDTLRQVEDTFLTPVEHSLNAWVTDFLPPPAESLGETVEAPPPKQTPGTVSKPNPATHPEPAWEALLDHYTFVVHRIDGAHYEIIPQKRQPAPAGNARQPFQFSAQLNSAIKQARDSFEQNLIQFVVLGRQLVRALVTSFFTLFLVLMISGFLLLEPERVHTFARSLIPAHYHATFDDWLEGLDHGLSGVVRGQAIICLVNGIVTAIGIGLLGVPFVVTLSVMAAVFSLIPIFGVLISTVPILIMALTISLPVALLALGWVLIVHFIEGNFLNPKILGDSAKIHPVLIIFALLVGENLGGVVGALLAVPIFSLVQNSFLFLKNKAEHLESTPVSHNP